MTSPRKYIRLVNLQFSMIVSKKRNCIKPERSKKLVFVHYNKRLIRKIQRVDYESEHVVETLSENDKVGVSVCVFGVIFPHTLGTRIEVLGPPVVTF
jgi:hypothetical protein